jgi:hypothetical protein
MVGKTPHLTEIAVDCRTVRFRASDDQRKPVHTHMIKGNSCMKKNPQKTGKTSYMIAYRNGHASAMEAKRKQSTLALQTLITNRELSLGHSEGVAKMKHTCSKWS